MLKYLLSQQTFLGPAMGAVRIRVPLTAFKPSPSVTCAPFPKTGLSSSLTQDTSLIEQMNDLFVGSPLFFLYDGRWENGAVKKKYSKKICREMTKGINYSVFDDIILKLEECLPFFFVFSPPLVYL